MTRYFKTGRSLRIERTAAVRSAIELHETGFALEEDELFSCGPVSAAGDLIDNPQADHAADLETSIGSVFPANVGIERLVLVAGSTTHSIQSSPEGNPSATWRELFVRLHLSMTNRARRIRTVIDLGGSSASQIDLADIRRIVSAVGDYSGERRSLPPGAILEIAPHITAALLAHPTLPAAPPVTIHQSPHDQFRFDGYGKPIEEVVIDSSALAPNFFRPSYRARPVRGWFHVDLRYENESEQTADFSAEAVIGPLGPERGRIVLALLCRDSDGSVFATQLELPADAWTSSITFASSERRWFPYAAGTWGRSLRIRL